MKICIVNCVYGSGSTGKIVADLFLQFVKSGHDVKVLYGRGSKPNNPSIIKVATECESMLHGLLSRLTGIMYGYSFVSTIKIINTIKKYEPDIVNIHCINANFVNVYLLIEWLKCKNIKTVVTNHAEFFYTANCGYALDCTKYMRGCGNCPRLKNATNTWLLDGTHRSWKKMNKAFNHFHHLKVINVSPWLTKRAMASTILNKFEHYTVFNGLDTSVFSYKNNYDINKNEKIIFQATANFSDDILDIKGGHYLIKLANRFISQNVKFVVAGKFSENIVVPPNMVLLGNVQNQDKLANLYSQADLVVLTSRKETFSMITAESLCCGTPVVGFQAGAPEMIAIPQYSEFVEFGNIDKLESAVKNFLRKSFEKSAISSEAIEIYSRERMAKEYLNVFRSFV